ncbi:MAG TPA: hypothetical protein VFG42_24605 [Baekduia sp.]|uniref:hypothetical protein n=1 Tax=Baekduia sp. TaxID=2600305 RepID=UPI002D771BB6|nr:hypothetical protein [Baekduia sp.]HET6509998.1 hypothetical protein [Baekduia sp.]
MSRIPSVTLEVPAVPTAAEFYAAAFGVGPQLRLRQGAAPSTGFRGFTLSAVVAQRSAVDELFAAALAAGATALKPAKRQFWGGYSGVLRAPDGTIWKVATDARTDDGRAAHAISGIVLLLGVADIVKSKDYYVQRGFAVAKSYGRKYVEFESDGDAVKLGLYRRGGLAKDAGVPADGSGAHRLAIGNDVADFVDLDGFAWELDG